MIENSYYCTLDICERPIKEILVHKLPFKNEPTRGDTFFSSRVMDYKLKPFDTKLACKNDCNVRSNISYMWSKISRTTIVGKFLIFPENFVQISRHSSRNIKMSISSAAFVKYFRILSDQTSIPSNELKRCNMSSELQGIIHFMLLCYAGQTNLAFATMRSKLLRFSYPRKNLPVKWRFRSTASNG